MIWQDYVFTGVGVFFAASLVPEVIKRYREKSQTMNKVSSTLTSLGLYTLAYTESTLGLTVAPIVTTATATLWATLLHQRIKYKKLEDKL